MGMPEDDDEVPDHYFCEDCRPMEHTETIQAMKRGEKIWETRNKIYQNEKKAGKRKSGAKSGKVGGGWLKKDVPMEMDDGNGGEEAVEEENGVEEVKETAAGSKRKRGEDSDPAPAQQDDVKAEPEGKSTRGSRQEKRRKATVDEAAPSADTEPETEIVPIDQLPNDRKKVAEALSKILLDDFNTRAQAGSLQFADGETAKSLGDHHASLIEHALQTSHQGPGNPGYTQQFRALHANLKKNKMLITRLLDGSLTADELSTMNSKDMASEELQKERAAMKEQLDRQNVLRGQVEEDRPRYRRTHKGDELIEDENAAFKESAAAQPVRERSSVQEAGAGSPTTEQAGFAAGSPEPLKVDTVRSQSMSQTGLEQRRTSSQQFDMNNIWAKTAQSPTSTTTPGGGGGGAGAARPLQMPPKRRSSAKHSQTLQDGATTSATGTKEDADIDRMLQDDDEDETYSPTSYLDPDGIVWRGKLIQSADSVSPTVNARFVAGRDLTPTIPWRDLLPAALSIDGRLQVAKAEEYLCSLQWSQSSDVSVLQFTAYDDAEGFEAVFQYFKSRGRYAVVNKDKPTMVKDLYVIPVDAGQEVPSHVGMLEFNRLGGSVDEKCLLASLVVARGQQPPQAQPQQTGGSGLDGAADVKSPPSAAVPGANGQHTLPQHMRGAVAASAGPAGSPLNAGNATFSPPAAVPLPGGVESYSNSSSLPPNPYTGAPQQQPPPGMAYTNPLVNEILGSLQYAPTAKNVLDADPLISREKLEHLKLIMEEDPRTRTDLGALAGYLNRLGSR